MSADASYQWLQHCAFPWVRRSSINMAMRAAWIVLYGLGLAAVFAFFHDAALGVLCKHILAMHGAFVFVDFFSSPWPSADTPKATWERIYVALASFFCIMLLVQAALAFSGVAWGAAALAGVLAHPPTAYVPHEDALVSIALAIAICAATWVDTRGFRNFVLRLRKHTSRSR